MRVYIAGMGIISPWGKGRFQTECSMAEGKKKIRPLSLFPTAGPPLPVGSIDELPETAPARLPRTHLLSLIAAEEAMAGAADTALDAIVMGVTTGGMLNSEALLKKGIMDPELYTYHSPSSVAESLAYRYKCRGPVITVSTACSSGAVAIKIALEMLRCGKAEKVLAGGADSLCRLTYYGFHSLQLIDPAGARPFDRERRGMSVSEGAAMVLLAADQNVPDNAVAEILGGGLSCDACHAAAPHPEGEGAAQAMMMAVRDANISLSDIDYVCMHGTGTLDNDLSEARAMNALFRDKKPRVSSVKGAIGHPLGAAGAMGTVISALAISNGLIPANTGCNVPDPALNLHPHATPSRAAVRTVLSNAFGFGGNNAAIVIGYPEKDRCPPASGIPRVANRPVSGKVSCLSVAGAACITGAGNTEKTLEKISAAKSCKGTLSLSEISMNLPSKTVRRLKRLPRLAMSLSLAAHKDSGLSDSPSSVFMGTGWGALSETHDFLNKLFESDERFSSPADFIGSVHNAAAAQIAILLKSTGPNITVTGGDYSFEQALITAGFLANHNSDDDSSGTVLLVGADEFHHTLSPLFDRSVLSDENVSDGGGALCLKQGCASCGPKISPVFFEIAENNPSVIQRLVRTLGNPKRINEKFASVFAGIPAAFRKRGEKQLQEFLLAAGFRNPVIDYRKLLGEFASASATATVLAVRFVRNGEIPLKLNRGQKCRLDRKGILMIGLGNFLTASEVMPQL
ncbi:MAG: hypothetical protein B6245_00470 [Desulfobacteraceae bacterium 4572_88]|nr:MAG: hypothetical protein B6245_00470 [Desulfobacteraceae bacterium 4572_88]